MTHNQKVGLPPMTQKQNFAKYPGYIMFALQDDPASRPGWDILEIISGDRVESHNEAVGVAQGFSSANGGGNQDPMVMDGQRHYVVRKTQFLMGRKEADVLGELNTKVADALKRTQEAEVARDAAIKNQNQSQTSLASLASLEADRERALKERQSLVEVKNKLEADMAKLKKMLGEKTINDVLNPMMFTEILDRLLRETPGARSATVAI